MRLHDGKQNKLYMKARTYNVTLEGQTPLLMHALSIEWNDAMKKWQSDPANKSGSVAGDDRSPAFKWMGAIYTDAQRVVMPSDNLMTMLREGGKRCPSGKGKGTLKSQSQSGIVVDQVAWPILINGKEVPFTDKLRKQLMEETDFQIHKDEIAKLGFELFVKAAGVNGMKHVRVRPRFNQWSTEGSLTVLDDQISTDVLKNILTFAGCYSGMGDWRPSSPKAPGSFGKFISTVKEA